MKVSLVITTLNKHKLVRQRLFEVHKYLPDLYEVVVTTDAITSPELNKVIGDYSDVIYPLTLLDKYPAEEGSFASNVNRGASHIATTADIIIITQDDVQISGNFLPSLLNMINTHDEHCVAGRLLNFDTGWNNFHGYIVPYIEGWFIACSSEVWNDIGGMDENIKPYDAEDIDFAIKAKEKGYALINFDSPYLQHIRGQTIALDESRRKITKKNVQYVKEKWTKEDLEEIYNE